MYVPKSDAIVRKFGCVEVANFITKSNSSSFSLAVVALSGCHPRTVNSESDRAYYILEGNAKVEIDSDTFQVEAGDAVYIPKNTIHSIAGTVKYVIVNAPPFNPSSEEAA